MSFAKYVQASDFIEGPRSLFTNTKGELGAFTQLFFDNLSTMVGLLGAITGNFVLNFGVAPSVVNDLIFKKSTAGLGLALVWGNVFYSYQGARQSRLTGRQFTAQPYGINTVGAFAFVFTVMIPVFLQEWAKSDFSDDPDVKAIAFKKCFNVAIAGNFIVGVMNVILALGGPIIMSVLPPAALLVPIAGIGFSFLGIGQMTANFGNPIVGFLPLMFVFVGWYANIKLFGLIPEAGTIIIIGTVLAWIDPTTRGKGGPDGYGLVVKTEGAVELIKSFVPDPESFAEVGDGMDLLGNYLGIVIPVAVTATAFTLMCLLSARNAGDPYPIRETMLMDGIGTIISSLLGSPFGTVVYIGHPVHKRTGATVGYSWLNGIVYFIIGFSGLFAIFEAIFPIQAVGPIILLVGLMICEDAVKNLPPRHWCILFFGLFFSTCDWSTTAVGVSPISSAAAQWGIFAMKRGAPLIVLFWSAILTYVIDRYWWRAAAWCLLTALFAVFGIIHMPESGVARMNEGTLGPFVPGKGDQACTFDIVEGEDSPWPNNPAECGAVQWRFCVGYLMMAVVCLGGEVTQRMGWGLPRVDSSKDGMDFQIDWDDVSHLKLEHTPHGERAVDGGSGLEYMTKHGSDSDIGVVHEKDSSLPTEPSSTRKVMDPYQPGPPGPNPYGYPASMAYPSMVGYPPMSYQGYPPQPVIGSPLPTMPPMAHRPVY